MRGNTSGERFLNRPKAQSENPSENRFCVGKIVSFLNEMAKIWFDANVGGVEG